MCRSAACGSRKPSAPSAPAASVEAAAARRRGARPRAREQRTVEELLVQPADLAPRPATPSPARRRGPRGKPSGAAQPTQLLLVLRDQVGTLSGTAGSGARGCAGNAYLPMAAPSADRGTAADELRQPHERAWAAHLLVAATVHQLQQLHRELDVAQPPAAELEPPRRPSCAGRCARTPAAHRLHFLHVVLPARRPATLGLHHRECSRAQCVNRW